MESGIYVILNTMTEQVYVGQSKRIRKRLQDHKSYLKGLYHPNPYLQSSFNKYGEGKFVFRPMEYCAAELLTEKEQYWINQFNSMNRVFGFNMKEADFHAPISEETRAKMSEAKKGKDSNRKGKKHSEESRAKMSAAKKGKDSNRKGKTLSEETRAKISASCRGKTRSEETRTKISAAAIAANAKRRMESL
jgi:group I intron endonuclease